MAGAERRLVQQLEDVVELHARIALEMLRQELVDKFHEQISSVWCRIYFALHHVNPIGASSGARNRPETSVCGMACFAAKQLHETRLLE
jgi:hypothetical protein